MSTFPSIPFTAINFSSVNPTRVTRSINGREQRLAVGSQRYEMVSNFSRLTQTQQRQLSAFIEEMRGSLTAFDLQLPDYLADSTGNFTGTITVAANASAGATSVTITSAAAGGVVVLRAGDYIRFSNHTKLYQVKTTVTAAIGDETLALTQPLRSAVVGSTTTITHRDVKMSARFESNNQEFRVDTNQFTDFNLFFVEVLQ